jgi:hypothetical protein
MKPNNPLEPLRPYDEPPRARSQWVWIAVAIVVTALIVFYLLARTNAVQEGGVLEGRLPVPGARPT